MGDALPPGYRDDLTAVETPLMATASFAAGWFRCPVHHPVFAGSGPLRCHYLVFPRTSVRIRHEVAPEFTSTAATATVYNPGDAYRRHAVDAHGDRSDYLVVAPALLRELMQEVDPGGAAMQPDETRFRARRAAVGATLFLRQRRFFEALRAAPPSPLRFEEACTRLVRELLAEYARAPAPATRQTPERRARQVEAVERACLYLAQHATQACTLADVARHAFLSPCHLARVFPCYTGYTLHAFQTQLRLRMALEDLREGDPGLSTLALRLGFSHHSHFTSSFRRSFQLTPRAFRRLSA